MPRRLKQLLITVFAGATLALVYALTSTHALAHPPTAWRLTVAALLMLVADVPLLHIRWGHDQYSFTWSEVALLLTFVLVPPAWAILMSTAGVLLLNIVARRATVKALFNTASVTSGVALACVVMGLLGGTPKLERLEQVPPWFVLIAGIFTFVVWNAATVAAAVGFSQRVSIRSVLQKGLLLRLMIFAGNTMLGLVIIGLALWNRGALAVLPVTAVVLHFLYSGYLRAMQDRDTWRVLQAASRELNQLQWSDLARAVLDRAQSLFQATFVELMLTDGEPGTRATVVRRNGTDTTEFEAAPLELASTFWPRAFSEREIFRISSRKGSPARREELEDLDIANCVVAPLLSRQSCLGTLRVGFSGAMRFGTRETQLLSTFTDHVATAVLNARLFETVQDERTKLGSIVDNSSDGILALDTDGRVASWNPAMAAITGRAETEVLGSRLVLGTEGVGDGCLTPSVLHERLADGEDAVDGVISVRGPSGDRWLNVCATAVRNSGGDLESMVIVAHDITAMREAAEAKQDFIATVSHELRTPLTSLRGFIHTLLRDDYHPEPEELRECHERIQYQATRLQRLIEDVLSVSSLDRGQFSIDRESVSVDEVVAKVIIDLPVADPVRPVRHYRAGLAGMAVADPGRLEQVVNNLISNADKYSPAGAAISVVVERVQEEVLVSVMDEGPGIPEDMREAVFEPFRRLGNHLTRPVGGTGLGLHIARRLVTAMGGRIWVEGEVGHGATFRFALPAAPLVAHSAAS
jgi:two-component system phosphate regulon sensor histidine kinase PhoR